MIGCCVFSISSSCGVIRVYRRSRWRFVSKFISIDESLPYESVEARGHRGPAGRRRSFRQVIVHACRHVCAVSDFPGFLYTDRLAEAVRYIVSCGESDEECAAPFRVYFPWRLPRTGRCAWKRWGGVGLFLIEIVFLRLFSVVIVTSVSPEAEQGREASSKLNPHGGEGQREIVQELIVFVVSQSHLCNISWKDSTTL